MRKRRPVWLISQTANGRLPTFGNRMTFTGLDETLLDRTTGSYPRPGRNR